MKIEGQGMPSQDSSSDRIHRLKPGELPAHPEGKRIGASKPLENPISRKDEVELSSLARDIQTIHQNGSEGSPEHLQRIAELRRQVESGTYHVPSSLLAEKILKAND